MSDPFWSNYNTNLTNSNIVNIPQISSFSSNSMSFNSAPMVSVFESHPLPTPTICNIPEPIISRSPDPIIVPAPPPAPIVIDSPIHVPNVVSSPEPQNTPIPEPKKFNIHEQPNGNYGVKPPGLCDKLYGSTNSEYMGNPDAPYITKTDDYIKYEYQNGHNSTYNRKTGETNSWTN
jgi:hypothetical protein